MIVYQDGEWRRFDGASPWAPADPNPDEHTGYYEDRLSFSLTMGRYTDSRTSVAG